MQLAQHLEMQRLMTGTEIRCPTPPLLAELWERGRAEGLRLGTLYVLTRPFYPGRRAAYHHDTGDVWVWLDSGNPERAAADLLHELAHAHRHNRHPATIGAYCRDEAATQRLAQRLARRWGIPHLFPDQMLHEYLTFVQRQRAELPLAGELAGDHSLCVAQAAFDALRALAAEHGWHGAAWDTMLWGDTYEPTLPGYTAIADLDRCLLRPSWSLGWGYGQGFDALTIPPAPQATRAARTLRWALQEAARRGRAIVRATTRLRRRHGTVRREGYHAMYHLRDVFPFVIAANQALLGACQWSAEARWAIYRDESDGASSVATRVRYYTLTVDYRPPLERAPEGPTPPAVHLWAAVFGSAEIDAALQMYIRGWKRSTALRGGTLLDTLEERAQEESTVRHVVS